MGGEMLLPHANKYLTWQETKFNMIVAYSLKNSILSHSLLLIFTLYQQGLRLPQQI